MANADFDQIPSNVSFGASQSVRRNSGNSAFELFTATADGLLPSQSGNSGKFLSTNGSAVSWASVATGITIGTTPISSGTNNRVLFQSSGVVSQSDRMQFDGSDFSLINQTAATGGTPTQNSPFIYLQGSQWRTDSSVSEAMKARIAVKPNATNAASLNSPTFAVEAYSSYVSGWQPVFSVGAKSDDYLTTRVRLASSHSNWGGFLDVSYLGEFIFRDLSGNLAQLTGVSFGKGSGLGYEQFWVNSYDAEVRTHFNGKILLSAGRPSWKYGDNAGNGGTEFVQSDLPITIGGSSNPTGYKLEVVGDSKFGGNVNINDGNNLIFGTSTGTKIGTGSTEKIAFWGGTPVTQRTIFGGITDATGGTSGTTINIDDGMGGIDVAELNDALATIINRLNATRNILLDVGIAA